MQKLFDALTHLALPKSLTAQWNYPELVDKIHRAYLRRALGTHAQDHDISQSDLIGLRRLALYLEAATTLEMPEGQELQDSLYVAASIFEFLATYQRVSRASTPAGSSSQQSLIYRIAAGDLSDEIRALLLYSLGHYEANSEVIGRRLLRLIPDLDSGNLQLIDHAALVGLRTVIALLSRKLREAASSIQSLGPVLRRIADASQASGFPEEEMLALTPWLEIAEACAILSMGLLDGLPAVQGKGRSRLREIARRAQLTRDSSAFWMADKLLLVADQMISRSVYNILNTRGLPDVYLDVLAEDGVSELWSSQVAVIEAGLLDSDVSFAVNLPTGAGKSLIAELAIMKASVSAPGGWGLYLVPTRALVHQVEADLRRRLPKMGIKVRTIIAGGEPSLNIEAELDELSQSQTITILTPEKLDIYIRNDPNAFGTCRLIVVDEAHKLGDKNRGALIDSLLTRCKLLIPNVRLLLLSAVMSNVLEIAQWLDSPLGHVRALWRPTRQLKGLAVRHNDQPAVPLTRNMKGQQQTSRRIPYSVGVVLAHDADELVPPLTLDLPDLATNEEKIDFRGESKSPSPTDHAIGLATRFARLGGIVVVFLDSRASAEKCAREIVKNLTVQLQADSSATELLEHLAIVFGGSHQLLNYVRSGVGYHHRGLPLPARRAVETALRKGDLRVLCTTATLREGLNTPATTVIIAGVTHFDPETEEQEVMSIQDFVNVAGRAGRPGKDTEGQVIFIPDRIFRMSIDRVVNPQDLRRIRRDQATALQRTDSYFFPTPTDLVVRSALQEVQIELEAATNVSELPVLSPGAQTMLLALYAAGLLEEESLQRFFSSSLAALQLQHTASVEGIAQTARRYISKTVERSGQSSVATFSKTGLSIDSCEILDKALRSLQHAGYDFRAPLRTGGSIERDRLEPLIRSVLEVPQLQSKKHFPTEDAADEVAEILSQWMNGASYHALASAHRFEGKTEKVVDYLAAAADRLSWGLGSAYLLLEQITAETEDVNQNWLDLTFQLPLNPEFGLIPMFIEYGVNNAVAAFLALLGVSEREAAQELAHAFNAEQQAPIDYPSFEEVENWLRGLTREKVSSLGSLHGYRAQVLIDDLNLKDDSTEEITRKYASLAVSPNPKVVGDLDDLIGEMCFINPSRAAGSGTPVYALATRQQVGVLAETSLRDYARISTTGKTVYGVVVRRNFQQVRNWGGFGDLKDSAAGSAGSEQLILKAWG